MLKSEKVKINSNFFPGTGKAIILIVEQFELVTVGDYLENSYFYSNKRGLFLLKILCYLCCTL